MLLVVINLLHAAMERIQRESERNNGMISRVPNLMTITQEIEVAGARIRQSLVNMLAEEVAKLTADVASNTSTIATVAQSIIDNVSGTCSIAWLK